MGARAHIALFAAALIGATVVGALASASPTAGAAFVVVLIVAATLLVTPPRELLIATLALISVIRPLPISTAITALGSSRGIVAADLTMVAFLAKARVNVAQTLRRSWPARALLVLLSWSAVSNIANTVDGSIWFEWLAYLLLFGYVCAIDTAVERWSAARATAWVVIGFVIGVTAGAFGGMLGFIGIGNPLAIVGRATGFFLFPGQLASLCVLALAIAPSISTRRRAATVVALSILAALLSSSRAEIAAIIVVLLGAPLFFRSSQRVRQQWVVGLIVGIATLGAVTFIPAIASRATVYETRFGRVTQEPFHVDNWRRGWTVFTQSPLVGKGLGNVRVPTSVQPHGSTPTVENTFEVHNSLIGLMAQIGVGGLLVWVYVAAHLARGMLRRSRDAYTSFVLLVHLVVVGQFNFVWRFRHLWVLLALAAAVERVRAHARQETVA